MELIRKYEENYLKDWGERNHYCKMRKITPWIQATETDWDNKVIDYLIWLGEMFKVTAATTRRKMSAVRYIHLAAGMADFSKCGIRYRMLIQAYSMKRPVNRKLPFNIDLMSWVQKQFEDQQEQTKNEGSLGGHGAIFLLLHADK